MKCSAVSSDSESMNGGKKEDGGGKKQRVTKTRKGAE